MNKTKNMVTLMMLSALAIVINLFESAFIPPIQFGIRFGLANIVALITIKLYGSKEMIIVNSLRVTIGNLLKGMIFGSPFWISFSGVTLSTIAIIVCDRLKTSILFTSIVSAIFHSLGQVIMVMFFYNQAGVVSLFPVLALTSIGTGILTGFVTKGVLKRIVI